MAEKPSISQEEIVLYDIPSGSPCKAWSLNTWRVRLILNYKNIPYKTQWLEYPDIKPTLQPHFQNSNIETFTVPTIALPGGNEHIMNSKDIARALEIMYPSPPLLIDPPLAKRVTELQIKIWDAIEPMLLVHVHKWLLNEVNFAYWRETREPWLNPGINSNGKQRSDAEAGGNTWRTLEDVENELAANDAALMNKAWEAAGPAIDEMAALLSRDLDGPFFQGREASFSDFQWIGFLIFIRRIGDDQWSRMKACVKNFEPHEKLLASAEKWTERDGY